MNAWLHELGDRCLLDAAFAGLSEHSFVDEGLLALGERPVFDEAFALLCERRPLDASLTGLGELLGERAGCGVGGGVAVLSLH